ncbi:hypothetical protein Tco_0366076 [Tanacetum coccineum]
MCFEGSETCFEGSKTCLKGAKCVLEGSEICIIKRNMQVKSHFEQNMSKFLQAKYVGRFHAKCARKCQAKCAISSSKLEYQFQDKENSKDIFSFGSVMEDFICVVFVPDRNIVVFRRRYICLFDLAACHLVEVLRMISEAKLQVLADLKSILYGLRSEKFGIELCVELKYFEDCCFKTMLYNYSCTFLSSFAICIWEVPANIFGSSLRDGLREADSTTTSHNQTATNLSSALVEYPLLESIAAKESRPLTTSTSFNASTLENSVPPGYLKFISNLENEVMNVSMEKEQLKIEVMQAQAMINILQCRVDKLTEENNGLRRCA